MKKKLFYAGITAFTLMACTPTPPPRQENSEIVIRESDMVETPIQVTNTEVDSLAQGPFYKYALYRKAGDNGGFEEYSLIMNLYEPNIPDEEGELTHGRLTLRVRTPDNTESVKVAQRTIKRVEKIEGTTATISMYGTGEKPLYFDATISYDTINHTYLLEMKAPSQLEDLMSNTLVLQ